MSTSGLAKVKFHKIHNNVTDLDFYDEIQDFVNKFNSETYHRLEFEDATTYSVFYDRASHFSTEEIVDCIQEFECIKVIWEYVILGDGTDPSYTYECTSTYITETSSEDDELDNLSEVF